MIQELVGRNNKKKLSTTALCDLFNIARSSYYAGIKPKLINLKEVVLNALVQQAFNLSNHSAGARTISHIVSKQNNIKLTRYKAGKVMKKLGLISKQHKHKYKYREKEHCIHNNIVNREFSPTAPNQTWSGDVTYIRIKGGWCYLAIVMDLFSRKVVGYKVSNSPDSQLTSQAIKSAYAIRNNPKGVVFHSDQGTHYSSKAFTETLENCHIKASMSRRGNCWDNAPTERFFRSFKTEWMPKNGYDSQEQAVQAIDDYILGYYDCVRPHSHNNYQTPAEKEDEFYKKAS